MAHTRAPKQWSLTKTETINTFENWKQNLVYTLTLDPNFGPFLLDGSTWNPKTRAAPLRGCTDDGDDVPEPRRHTAQSYPRTNAWANRKLLPGHFPKYYRQKFYVSATNMADN